MNLLKSLKLYFKESRQELDRVTWPGRAQVIQYTVAVVLASAAVAFYLGFLDSILVKLTALLLTRR